MKHIGRKSRAVIREDNPQSLLPVRRADVDINADSTLLRPGAAVLARQFLNGVRGAIDDDPAEHHTVARARHMTRCRIDRHLQDNAVANALTVNNAFKLGHLARNLNRFDLRLPSHEKIAQRPNARAHRLSQLQRL